VSRDLYTYIHLQMSGKSSGGMADYAKIALPLVGTMVLCEWIRRFMATLTGVCVGGVGGWGVAWCSVIGSVC